MSVKKVLAITGSTRKGSSNERILRYLGARYSNEVDFVYYDSIEKLPLFNPDLDTDPLPDEVTDLRGNIARSQGVIICTPEYIFALPAALKNLIEWLVSTTTMEQKPTAFIIASGLGELSYASMGKILQTLGARVEPDSSLLLQGARAKFDQQGVPVHEETEAKLNIFMQSFIASITD